MKAIVDLFSGSYGGESTVEVGLVGAVGCEVTSVVYAEMLNDWALALSMNNKRARRR